MRFSTVILKIPHFQPIYPNIFYDRLLPEDLQAKPSRRPPPITSLTPAQRRELYKRHAFHFLLFCSYFSLIFILFLLEFILHLKVIIFF